MKVKTVAFRLTASQLEDLAKISTLYGSTIHDTARLLVIQSMPAILREQFGQVRDHFTSASSMGHQKVDRSVFAFDKEKKE